MNDILDINIGIQKIEKYFSNFFDGTFRLTKSKVDRKHFGNWVVALQSEDCIIKFIQDRGSVSVLIAPVWASVEPFDLDHFIDVNLLIDFKNKNQSIVTHPSQYAYDIDKVLSDTSTALQRNFQELLGILNGKDFLQTEKDIKTFHLQRLKRIYPNME